MLRTFETHALRETRPLDGWWDFAPAPEAGRVRGLPAAYPRRIRVPCAWESLPGLETYRGRAWFRRTVETDGERALRLEFGGVSHTATVRLDGRIVGRHHDAFTPWSVVVPRPAAGAHELVVEVDNGFGAASALHLPNDYYTYGGITRPVECAAVPAVFIEALHATPRRHGRRWALDCAVALRNLGRQPARRGLVVAVGDREADAGRVAIPAGGVRVVRRTLGGLDVEPWSAATPRLYEVGAWLTDGDAPVDDLLDRTGFREVAVRGRAILLNGRPLRPRGYNNKGTVDEFRRPKLAYDTVRRRMREAAARWDSRSDRHG
jgi:beta-glucuronidase